MSLTATLLTALLVRFRRLRLLASAGIVVGGVALLLGGAAWSARLGWFNQPWWVLATWGAALAVLGATAVSAGRSLHRLSPRWLADQFEHAGFRRGALRGHLEAAAMGSSDALLAIADRRHADELAARSAALLDALLRPFQRRLTQSGLLALAGAALLGSAGSTHGAAALLWRPLEAWSATVAPIRITVSANEIERGGRVEVGVLARGRQHAILWLRAPGSRGVVRDSRWIQPGARAPRWARCRPMSSSGSPAVGRTRIRCRYGCGFRPSSGACA